MKDFIDPNIMRDDLQKRRNSVSDNKKKENNDSFKKNRRFLFIFNLILVTLSIIVIYNVFYTPQNEQKIIKYINKNINNKNKQTKVIQKIEQIFREPYNGKYIASLLDNDILFTAYTENIINHTTYYNWLKAIIVNFKREKSLDDYKYYNNNPSNAIMAINLLLNDNALLSKTNTKITTLSILRNEIKLLDSVDKEARKELKIIDIEENKLRDQLYLLEQRRKEIYNKAKKEADRNKRKLSEEEEEYLRSHLAYYSATKPESAMSVYQIAQYGRLKRAIDRIENVIIESENKKNENLKLMEEDIKKRETIIDSLIVELKL